MIGWPFHSQNMRCPRVDLTTGRLVIRPHHLFISTGLFPSDQLSDGGHAVPITLVTPRKIGGTNQLGISSETVKLCFVRDTRLVSFQTYTCPITNQSLPVAGRSSTTSSAPADRELGVMPCILFACPASCSRCCEQPPSLYFVGVEIASVEHLRDSVVSWEMLDCESPERRDPVTHPEGAG